MKTEVKTCRSQALKITEYAARDHAMLENLRAGFETSLIQGRPDAGKRLKRLENSLEHYFTAADKLLYASYESRAVKGACELTDGLRKEHESLLKMIRLMKCSIEYGCGAGVYLTRFASILAFHHRKEEQLLFPWLDRALDEADRGRLVSAMKRLRGALEEGFSYEEISV